MLSIKPVNIINKINFSGIANAKRSAANLDIAPDSISLRPYYDVVNEKLKETYGIDSDIKDGRILGKILPAVEEFCKLNKDENLFNGLKLKESKFNSEDEIYLEYCNADENEYLIVFNSSVDWKNLDKFTKKEYDSAKIASYNPEYFLYKALAGFLNFQFNPYATEINLKTEPEQDVKGYIYRITDSSDIADFNNSYIAAKMSREFVPCELDEYFRCNIGNTDLKYRKAKPLIKNEGVNFNFKSKEEAQKYLFDNYKIKADFNNLRYANECCGAVFDLVHAIGDESIFEGLTIETKNIFQDTSASAETTIVVDKNEAKITMNPASNWKYADKCIEKDFKWGYFSANSIKNDIFMHELAHYLDFMGNPTRYYNLNSDFCITDEDERIFARVSQYASIDNSEFCAEYVAGRMAGIKYPKAVDERFEYFWNGPVINFPN